VVRRPVKEPLQTGLKAIDSMIPIGRGQRELIIGDRQTGKTALAWIPSLTRKKLTRQISPCIVSMCNWPETVHCGPGCRQAGELRGHGIHCCHQCHGIRTCPPSVYCSILRVHHGEYFRDNGMHAVIIYDDLSKHAVAYRQLSCFYGDLREGRHSWRCIYLHSRLLERAAKMNDKYGGGSLTAFRLLNAGRRLSAYIPTNVIFYYRWTDIPGDRPFLFRGTPCHKRRSFGFTCWWECQIKAMKQGGWFLRLDLAQYREWKPSPSSVAILTRQRLPSSRGGNGLSRYLSNLSMSRSGGRKPDCRYLCSNKWVCRSYPVEALTKYEQETLRVC